MPDPAALAALATAEEEADIEQQRRELARIAATCTSSRPLPTQSPDNPAGAPRGSRATFAACS